MKLRGYTKGYNSERRWQEVGLARDCKDRSACVSGDGAGVCEQPNDSDQIPKDGTQSNDRRAGGSSEGQGRGAKRSK